MKILDEPKLLTVQGTFFPCILLISGWWERQNSMKEPKLTWQNGLQEWLYRGFEEWAPSWDISLSVKGERDSYLFAQIGSIDEANSLPIIIPNEKAKIVRENLLSEELVFEAEITGLLCHRRYLPKPHLTRIGQWGKLFDYCILLNEEDKRYTISRRLDKKTMYSGYLWQCWGPKEWLKGMKTPRLDQVYFIWEHTDFAKPDALEYNLDSLQHKALYLQSKIGDLVLLQKSSSLVPGDPLCLTELFYYFVLGYSYKNSNEK
jgi:hypothetical protein